jgi:hypothetical protein
MLCRVALDTKDASVRFWRVGALQKMLAELSKIVFEDQGFAVVQHKAKAVDWFAKIEKRPSALKFGLQN